MHVFSAVPTERDGTPLHFCATGYSFSTTKALVVSFNLLAAELIINESTIFETRLLMSFKSDSTDADVTPNKITRMTTKYSIFQALQRENDRSKCLCE